MHAGAFWALALMVAVVLASAIINFFGARTARSTSDFLVASRTVRPAVNAAAISGEYLGAAAFLGVAGLVLKDGPMALWYPLGFTAGYLALLLFVAGPMRRSGAFSVPDFAEARLGSPLVRRVCVLFTLLILWLYVLPQLQGAGLTIAIVTTLPEWSGAAAAGAVVIATVFFGGMRSMTFVQAFQFWFKVMALAVPAVVLIVVFTGENRSFNRPAPPTFTAESTVEIHTDVELTVVAPVDLQAAGRVDGVAQNGPVRWEPGAHTADHGAKLTFPAGAPVPVVADAPSTDADWLTSGDARQDLFSIYSLLLALFLGTMGLPNVLARFYTNPDGRGARRTAVVSLAMVGGFFLLPVVFGALSRLYTPQLLVSDQTDAAVLLLPAAMLGDGLGAQILAGVVAAGAWAAFLSTATGLVVSAAGVLNTDVLPRRLRNIRFAGLVAAVVPLALTLILSTRLDFADTVALAFAVAASTFCPLLLLGIWWRGLTDVGASAGVIVGGALSGGAVLVVLAGPDLSEWTTTVLLRPAAISVPVAFLTMIVVSKFTAKRIRPGVDRVLLRMHAPERLGLGIEPLRTDEQAEPADGEFTGGQRLVRPTADEP